MDNDSCDWEMITPSDGDRRSTINAWLETYLAGGGDPDYQTNAPAEMQEAWARGREIAKSQSLDEQFQWASGEVNELRGRYCPTQA